MPLYSPPASNILKPTDRRYGVIQFQGTKMYFSGNIDSQDWSTILGQSSNDGKDATTQAVKVTSGTGALGAIQNCGFFTPAMADMRHDASFEITFKTPAQFTSNWTQHVFSFQDTSTPTPAQMISVVVDPLPSLTSGVFFIQAWDTASSNPSLILTSSNIDTFVPGTWYKLKLRVESATKSIYCSVNNGPETVLNCTGTAIETLFTKLLRLVFFTRWTGANVTMELTIASIFFQFRAR